MNKAVWGTIVIIAAIVAASFYVDDRYAHAGDVAELKKDISAARNEVQYAADKVRKANLEDKIFELNIKSQKNNADQALLERYKGQVQEINRQWQVPPKTTLSN